MPEATNTLSEYVNPTVFSMQEWSRERALLLHYTVQHTKYYGNETGYTLLI